MGQADKEQHQDNPTKQGTLHHALDVHWDVQVAVMSTGIFLVPKLTKVARLRIAKLRGKTVVLCHFNGTPITHATIATHCMTHRRVALNWPTT